MDWQGRTKATTNVETKRKNKRTRFQHFPHCLNKKGDGGKPHNIVKELGDSNEKIDAQRC